MIISSPRNSKSKSSTENLSESTVNLEKSVCETSNETNRTQDNKKEFQNYVCKKSNLEGCILVQKDSVWECRLR